MLQNREPHVKDSAAVWKLCETEQAEGYIFALTFAKLVYVMRKELSPDHIHDVLKKMQLIFRFADFSAADMEKAVEMKWSDYEDAILAVTAERISADGIITRNVRDLKGSKVIALTPTEFIARFLGSLGWGRFRG